MIKVLHVTPDDKFFDDVFAKWENFGPFENKALLIASGSDYKPKYIANLSKLEIVEHGEDVKNRLQKDDYQVVYFHSLSAYLYKYVKFIPDDRTVIWWAWGFELYYENVSPYPLIKRNLYKPITQSYFRKRFWLYSVYHNILYKVRDIRVKREQVSVLRRIDYFQPVTQIEYALMQQVRGFRAKEFYYDGSLGISEKKEGVSPVGNILIGNSATSTNNHIDVLQRVVKCRQTEQKIIMPLNYGGDKQYLEWLKAKMQGIDNLQMFLDFMPKDVYFRLLDTCTYACFGVVRQQAMANIRYALNNGVKVFLYKDSIPYMSLKKLGFVVYAIEEMDEESLVTPLSSEEKEQNQKAYENEIERRSTLYQDFLGEKMKNYV